MTKEDTTEPQEMGQLPVLYKSLVPLMKDVHKDLKQVNNQNFSFVAGINAVPVVMQELPIAAKYFPIIFASDAPGVMLAVMGVKSGQNLFVNEDGSWLKNSYVPAYIRRYPYFVARMNAETDPVICIDEQSPFLSADGDVPLFKDGEATEALTRAIDFTRTVQQHIESTITYGEMMGEKDLLEDQEVSFKVGEEVKANVNGFKTVNRAKFDELDAETLKDWLGKGWVDATILHLASGGNFDRLWQMERERNG